MQDFGRGVRRHIVLRRWSDVLPSINIPVDDIVHCLVISKEDTFVCIRVKSCASVFGFLDSDLAAKDTGFV